MSTEVDNKQTPVAAAEDKPAAEAPAPAAEEAKDKPAAEAAGGDAAKTEGGEAAKEEDAVAADKSADVEAPAKPEPPVKYNVHRQNFEKDIVYLYQFSRTPVMPSLSPYCLKVETWLRLAGLKYEVSAAMISRIAKWARGWVLAVEKRFAGWPPFYSENPSRPGERERDFPQSLE